MAPEHSFLQIIKTYLTSNKAVLPVFDPTGLKIQREAAKPDPDTAVIEKMIICDPSMTTQVLRIANSAFYKGLQKASTVRAAIVRLGIREIANMAVLVSQKRMFRSKDPHINDLMQQLWRHSVACAISAQWIAHRCSLKARSQEAFTAGLLHDIGKLLILTVTDALRRSGTTLRVPSQQLLGEVLDTFHPQYGYTLLRHWNLPDAYCRVAQNHHQPEVPKENDLLMMVRLADKTANSMGIGLRGKETVMLAATPEAAYFGMSEVVLAELEIKLEDTRMIA